MFLSALYYRYWECLRISIEFITIPLLWAFWIMLPAYIPNPVAALCGGGTPVDFGRNFSDGRRIFGDGKTWRGLVIGILAGVITGLALIWGAGRFPPADLPQHSLLSVALLASGALLGDIVKSFFKRRFNRDRGSKWPVADQYDLVAGAFLLLLIGDPGWLFATVTLPVLVVILIITPVLHRATNIIGYVFKIKEVPW
jgi:CDP-2,3-bis-(O-geranylgeranyl)-sn-glycerol synthase